MSQKLSRRSFLKTAGAVAVAAAAMSTLTACGGGGSSTPDSKPTPRRPPLRPRWVALKFRKFIILACGGLMKTKFLIDGLFL